MMSWLTTCRSSYRCSQKYPSTWILNPSAVRPQFPRVPCRLSCRRPLSLSLVCFQAVKFECHLKNSLIMFLLSRAQGNINIAHYLYW